MEKVERIPAKIWNKTRMPLLTTFIQHSIGSPNHNNKDSHQNTRKKNKRRKEKKLQNQIQNS